MAHTAATGKGGIQKAHSIHSPFREYPMVCCTLLCPLRMHPGPAGDRSYP